MALPLLRPHYRGVAADLILNGRTDVGPRRIRHPRRWLAAFVLVGAALFLFDRWLQQREFDQLTDRVATAQTSIDYAEQRVNGMIQYGSPQLFITRTPAGVQTYLRGLVSDASTQGANDIAAAQTAVAGVSILPWHRNLVAARTAFLDHAQTWQDFLRSSLPDRFGSSDWTGRLTASGTAAAATLAAAVPVGGNSQDAARIDAIFAASP